MNSDLKLAIFSSGRSQIAVAKLVGMHEVRLSKIIRGHLEPTPAEMKALAKVLKRPVGTLFQAPAGSTV